MNKRKLFSPFFIPIWCICIALIAELFLFNFRALESRTFSPISSSSYEQTYSSNATVQSSDSGAQMITFGGGSSDDCYIELSGLDQVLSNIYLNISDTDTTANTVNVTLAAKDEGNELYYDLPASSIKRNSVGSQYIKLNLSGKAHALKIKFNNANGKTFMIGNIALNAQRPITFSIKRVFLIFLGLLVLYFMRPASRVYTIAFQPSRKFQKPLLLALVAVELVGFYKVAQYNPYYVNPQWAHHYQYANLAESMTEGHFYLDETPPASLSEMDNPYDYALRSTQPDLYAWDEAYYDGHYYVYFGVVPVLIFYLPYYLATGTAFPTWWGIIIAQTGIIIGILFLLNALTKKYFKSISLGVFLLMDLCMVAGSGLAVIATNATFYQLPISLGLAFTIWGLYFWISSNGSSVWRLIVGSVCMALVAGCRPQLLLGSFLAIPLILPNLWKTFRSGKRFNAIFRLIMALLPFFLFAAFIMYYNAARFGSPFDFGANYNLTTNDMTHRGFHMDRLPLGLYMYLLQPPCFTTTFPFITFAPTEIHYQGTTIMETMYGGLLWLNPLLFSMLFFHKVRNVLKEKKLFTITGFCILSGIILTALDTQMAGILFRYFCDFGFFFSFASVCILMSLEESYRNSGESTDVITVKQLYFHKLLFIAALATVILSGLTIQCIFNTVN